MAQPAAFRQAVERFSDWRWRLDNRYWITDEQGRRLKFEMNWAQARLFEEMHYLNVILKARQLGFTTFIQLFMLDACVFNANVRAGTIAHTLGDAEEIFKDKVKFPYENLPEQIKAANPAVEDSTRKLSFANNSSLRVGTDILTPRHRARPGIVAVPLDARTDAEIALFANVVSLTPGSLSLEISPDRTRLFVHAMFLDDPESFRRELKQGFERRVLELMR